MSGEPAVSDETLWRRVVNGDGDSFGILFDRHRDRVFHHASRVVASAHTAEDIADDVTDTDERERQTMILRTAFAQLKPSARDVLTLCVVEGFSTRDASNALGIAEGTVKSRLHRAKSQLGNLYNEVSSTREPVIRFGHGRKTS